MTKRASEIANEILPAVESLLNRDKMGINECTIDELESLIDQFEPKASPKLKGVIRGVKEDLREEETFKKLGIKRIADF